MMIEAQSGFALRPPYSVAAHYPFVILGRSRREAACAKGAANPAFVILGRSKREAACADPRIHAVTYPLRSGAEHGSLSLALLGGYSQPFGSFD